MKLAAAVEPNCTALALFMFAPLIVTRVPPVLGPLAGLMLSMLGSGPAARAMGELNANKAAAGNSTLRRRTFGRDDIFMILKKNYLTPGKHAWTDQGLTSGP